MGNLYFKSSPIKPKGKVNRIISLSIQTEIDDLIDLYAASIRVSKSMVIKDLLAFWYMDMKGKRERMLRNLLNQVDIEWRDIMKKNERSTSKMTFPEFEVAMRRILETKVFKEDIDDLFTILNNIYNE